MIIIDTPQKYRIAGLMRGREFTSSHLISTLSGTAGSEELLAFAKKMGLREAWLQKKYTWREHFDVMNSRYDAAISAGAVAVSCRELGLYMYAKAAVAPYLAEAVDA